MNDFDISSCSEKELLVYEGMCRILARGADIKSITAKDISDECGIGKGTLYLYFRTKDDIIIKTAMYILHKEALELERKLEKCRDFYERTSVLLDMAETSSKSTYSPFMMLLSLHTLTSDDTMLSIVENYRKYASDNIMRNLSQMIDDAKTNGEIHSEKETEYLLQVLLGAVSGINIMSSISPDAKNVKENAQELIRREF